MWEVWATSTLKCGANRFSSACQFPSTTVLAFGLDVDHDMCQALTPTCHGRRVQDKEVRKWMVLESRIDSQSLLRP